MNAKLIAIMAALAIAHFAAATNRTPPSEPHSAVNAANVMSLSKSQAEAAGMIDIVRNFDRIDANKDGVVTRNELRAYALVTRRHAPMT
jgi:Ca2+-binding EF-hand superfamily protein